MRTGWFVALATASLAAGPALAQRNPSYTPRFPGYSSPDGATTLILPVSAMPGVAVLTSDAPGTASVVGEPGRARVSDGPTMAAPFITSGPVYAESPASNGSSQATSSSPVVEFNADFILWFVKSAPSAPPLVSTGRLDSGTSSILRDEENFGFGGIPGLQLRGKVYVSDEPLLALDAGGFYLPRATDTQTFTSSATGLTAIGRPFTVAETGTGGFLAAGLPGFATGSVVVDATSEFWGADVNGSYTYRHSDAFRLSLSSGFRYLDLLESLNIGSVASTLPGTSQPFGGNTILGPATVVVTDNFETRNQFYGGQMGLETDFRYGRFSLNLVGKVALGTIHQLVDVRGVSSAVPAGESVGLVGAGGLLAQPSNGGRFDRNTFAVAPEFGAKFGLRFTDRLSGTVGYNFVYINDVVRPGDQIDGFVSASQIVAGSAFTGAGTRPVPVFQTTDFWAQGVSLGLMYQY